jgi:hypothetical protein
MEENRRKRKVSEDSSSSSDGSELNQKTSTQILNELFGAFEFDLAGKTPAKKAKKEKKKKKEKHKHKHKEKDKDRDRDRDRDKDRDRERDREKRKKRDHRKSSSDSRRVSLAADENLGIKIEVKKEKDSKKDDFKKGSKEADSRRDSKDSKNDIKVEPKTERNFIEDNHLSKILITESEKLPDHSPLFENDVMEIEKEKSPDLPSVAAKSQEDEEPPVVFDTSVKPATGNKVMHQFPFQSFPLSRVILGLCMFIQLVG